MTFFDQMKLSYADVPLTAAGEIPTDEFLQATEDLIRIFDTMGAAFVVVKNDMHGNVVKIRTRRQQDPAGTVTLQALVKSEKAAGANTATEGLLWLKRALQFVTLGLRLNLANPKEELSVSFKTAYGQTLSKFHGIMVRPIFSLAMKSCPYRATFYEQLGAKSPDFEAAMNKWVEALEKEVTLLHDFYVAQGLEKV
ncbi:hypothetical protein CXG81DRAFT_10182 [Caulochytrium protostelioides]|uniref:Glycolipid transfer protein n=1 Tax=Caulochytrium protostelioides TaxID=1555241 RepID=A0A4P9WVY2_9FUNG|nr:glycolipid transfer protein [Caulochytrium protostelioides]RKP02918.1 hypothetical protein CXG81DRAFT_10182 [Caulochytrium protostelioides]|eukprot:RKP02918.1 hypothetical protein CXG81DRAFT_10182 [Caulochytrium protostelioides]